MKLVINIPDEHIVGELREVGRDYDLKLKDNAINDRALGVAIETDLQKRLMADSYLNLLIGMGMADGIYKQFFQEE